MAHKILEIRRFVVASPAYLERHGVPWTPGDLAGHNCLRFNFLRIRAFIDFLAEKDAHALTPLARAGTSPIFSERGLFRGKVSMSGMLGSKLALAVAGVLLAGAAQALDLPGQTDSNRLLREGRFDELQILQSRQSREDFQREQQHFREQDRQVVVPQVQRPDVPAVRPSCQIQVFGNIFRRVCR